MDYATHLALRSIVRALAHGEHVNPDFPKHVVAALNDAIQEADQRGRMGNVTELEALRGGIANDFAIPKV
jgi:hypothetical protein